MINLIFQNDIDANPIAREEHRIRRQNVIRSLEHACECYNQNCTFPDCRILKRSIRHKRSCNLKIRCQSCRPIMFLCYVHAKKCNTRYCPVPTCELTKQKFEEKRCLELGKIITPDLRNHAVDLLLDTAAATTDPALVRDATYLAKKSEPAIFKRANNADEYYRYLAMQKWEIERHIDNKLKWQARNNQQRTP